jgi:DNA polymerase-3 subunit delta
LLKQAVARLRKRVGEVADLDFNLEIFDGENAQADSITAACNTLPFASDHRLVIVNGVERLPKEGLDLLATYAADPSPTCVLALAGSKLAKNTRLYKAVERLGGILERKALRGAEFVRGVVSLASDRGKRMSFETADVLVTASGEDLRRVSVELDKLVAYVGANEITRPDVGPSFPTLRGQDVGVRRSCGRPRLPSRAPARVGPA